MGCEKYIISFMTRAKDNYNLIDTSNINPILPKMKIERIKISLK